jgi:acetyltransferase-like isoleucine patch superfamily enzyme
MSNFFFFIFGNSYSLIFGFLIKTILKIYGAKIGKKFKAFSFPTLMLSNAKYLIIGDNVTFFGCPEIRIYDNSKIYIDNYSKIDKGARIISANNCIVKIGKSSVVGCYSIINGGGNVTIGENCLISGFVYLQSSTHISDRSKLIQEQGYLYKDILIENDVWIGAHSTILPGVKIATGAIVGANSVINKNVEQYSIVAGAPAKEIRKR